MTAWTLAARVPRHGTNGGSRGINSHARPRNPGNRIKRNPQNEAVSAWGWEGAPRPTHLHRDVLPLAVRTGLGLSDA
jgi:hypothetical protein